MGVWDVGGQQSIRQLWKHYYSNTDGIIFVIDANDTKRVRGNEHCAKEELHRLMDKQDLPNAKSENEMAEILELDSIKQNYHIQGTIAHTAEGLFEGLDWLSESFQGKKKNNNKK